MTEANAGAIRATIDFDAQGLESAVNKAMDRAASKITKTIDGSMAEVQESVESGFSGLGHKIIGFLGIEDISAAVNNLGRWVLNIGMETEKSLNMFKAVSGATADEMNRVSDAANELGNDIELPGVSAADAAEAMTELAKAGFTVDEAMAAAKGTLQLATAAQISAGEAATVTSEQINAFNLKAEDAGKVADLMANAANQSAADMTGMGDSLKQVSAVAEAAGLSITDTTAAIALMANNSIQGSDAGTSLKSMLVALAAPSDKAAGLMEKYGINVYDTEGHLKDLSGIIAAVTKGTAGLTDQQKQYALATIFGTDAIRAVNVLMHEGADGMAEMSKSLTKEGAAAELAAANSKGLVGSLGALQSTAESLAIEVYQNAAPAIDHWLRGRLDALPGTIDQISNYLSEMIDGLRPAAELIYDFVAAAEPGTVLAFKAALAAALGVVKALGYVLDPLVDLIESNEDAFRHIVSAIVAATIAYKVMNGVVAKTQAVMASESWTTAKTRVDALKTSIKSASAVTTGFRAASRNMIAAVGGPWGLAVAGAATAIGIFATRHAEAAAHVNELVDSLDDETGALTKSSRAAIAAALEDEGLLSKADDLGISLSSITDAATGNADAMAALSDKYVETALSSKSLDDVEKNLIQSLVDEGKTSMEIFDQVKDHSKTRADSMLSDIYVLIDGIRSESNAVGDARNEWDRKSRALKASKGATDAAASSSADLADQTHQSADSLEREARAANSARRAIKGLNKQAIDGISAQIDFEAASDDLRATIKDLSPAAIKSGHALDVNYKAGRDVYGAFLDLVNATEGVRGGMRRARDQIYNTIRPMVDSKAEAQRLTDQFFDLKNSADQIPDHVRVDVQANVEQAQSALDRIIRQAQSVPREIRTTYIVNQVNAINKHHAMAAAGHATGGAVYGPGTGTSDDVLTRLSNGEHVFTAAEVQAAGGQQEMYALRAALREGGLPALAEAAGGHGALVEHLAVSVGSKDELPDALDETLFHLRRLGRGSRYLN